MHYFTSELLQVFNMLTRDETPGEGFDMTFANELCSHRVVQTARLNKVWEMFFFYLLTSLSLS